MKPIEATKGRQYTGRCHCGAVTIKMQGPFHPFVVCHCLDCLRTSGFTWAAAKCHDHQLTITSGAEQIDWYASSEGARRGCCKTCHAHMFFKVTGTDIISISPGMFDTLEGMYTQGHIYRDSMPKCCQSLDTLPDIDDAFNAG
ncbi:MAG: GFA family protein [Candidatus Puniceispirillaceae bacterium]